MERLALKRWQEQQRAAVQRELCLHKVCVALLRYRCRGLPERVVDLIVKHFGEADDHLMEADFPAYGALQPGPNLQLPTEEEYRQFKQAARRIQLTKRQVSPELGGFTLSFIDF